MRQINRFGSLCLLTLLCVLCGHTYTHAATFSVVGSKILRDGQEFVIKGVNVNGPNWVWSRASAQDAELIVNVWKFNTVRVNCMIGKTNKTDNENLAALVEAFTNRGCVVQLEAHDFTGKQASPASEPTLSALQDWWTIRAHQFKDNSYVWFNIANEPGKDGDVPQDWMTMHESCIAAIRQTGARNIIVCDGSDWATEGAGGKTAAIPASRSAILTYGPALTARYANICFALHVYHQWNENGAAKMTGFLQRAHAANLSVHIGEWGQSAFDPWESVTATQHMFNAIRPLKVGRIAWHWYPGDNNKLTTHTGSHTPGGGWDIDNKDGARPTNLSWMGELAWDDNRNAPLSFDNLPLPLDRTGWTATAFNSANDSAPDKILDSKYGGWGAAWLSGASLNDGQWFQVDMGAPRTFNLIRISPQYDTFAPRGFKIYAFDDPAKMGEPIAIVLSALTEQRITLPVQTKRTIRVETTGGFKWGGWWTIREFNVYLRQL